MLNVDSLDTDDIKLFLINKQSVSNNLAYIIHTIKKKKELFSDIGPIKRARFIDKGLAEVVYVRIEHAKEAIDKYDLKELDGMSHSKIENSSQQTYLNKQKKKNYHCNSK